MTEVDHAVEGNRGIVKVLEKRLLMVLRMSGRNTNVAQKHENRRYSSPLKDSMTWGKVLSTMKR